MRFFAALLCVIALTLGLSAPAHAAPPAETLLLLSGGKCAGVSLDVEFVKGGACLNGRYYGSATQLPGWSFARSSTKTALDASGVLHTFTSGVPAITNLGLSVEQAATNGVLRSGDLSNAAWTSISATVTGNVGVAPDLTTTAAQIVSSATNGGQYQNVASFVASGSAYTSQGDLKTVSGGPNLIFFAAASSVGAGSVAPTVTINGSTCAFVSASASVSSETVTQLANGWCHVTATFTAAATATTTVAAGAVNSGTTFQAWGMQTEGGPFATSYIPTTSAQAARAADVASIGTPIGATGSFLGWAYGPNDSTASGPRVAGYLAAASAYATASPTNVAIFNSSVGNLSLTVATSPTALMKIAASWSPTGRSLSVNGLAAVSDSAAMPASTGVIIGSQNTGGQFLNSFVQKLVFYPTHQNPQALSSK